jgi:hypothetical protein
MVQTWTTLAFFTLKKITFSPLQITLLTLHLRDSHWTSMKSFQALWSPAIPLTLFHDLPVFLISFSIILRHVLYGLPLLLYPWEFPSHVVFSIAIASLHNVCLVQFHFLLFIWISIGFCLIPLLSHIYHHTVIQSYYSTGSATAFCLRYKLQCAQSHKLLSDYMSTSQHKQEQGMVMSLPMKVPPCTVFVTLSRAKSCVAKQSIHETPCTLRHICWDASGRSSEVPKHVEVMRDVNKTHCGVLGLDGLNVIALMLILKITDTQVYRGQKNLHWS